MVFHSSSWKRKLLWCRSGLDSVMKCIDTNITPLDISTRHRPNWYSSQQCMTLLAFKTKCMSCDMLAEFFISPQKSVNKVGRTYTYLRILSTSHVHSYFSHYWLKGWKYRDVHNLLLILRDIFYGDKRSKVWQHYITNCGAEV